MAKLVFVLAACLIAHLTCAADSKAGRKQINGSPQRCNEQHSEQACLDQHCFYCESTAVPGHSGCFAESRVIPKSKLNSVFGQQYQPSSMALTVWSTAGC
jgi:hypothetical protein